MGRGKARRKREFDSLGKPSKKKARPDGPSHSLELKQRSEQNAAALAAKQGNSQEVLRVKAEVIKLKHENNEYEKIVRELVDKVNDRDSHVRDLEQQLKQVRQLEEEHAKLCEENRRRLEEQQLRLLEMDKRRQDAVDELYEATGKIYVYVRARPMLPKEAKEEKALAFPSKNTVAFASGRNREHKYSVVWGEEATQVTVFKELQRFVQDVLDGISCCVFAYGQTGSGKTYTLYGDGCDLDSSEEVPGMGIIPRALRCVFNSYATLREAGWNYTFSMSFVEIYNEQLHDLLDLDAKPILRTDKSGVPQLANVVSVPVASAAEAFDELRRASQNRTIAATSFNEQSSRSHVLFRLSVTGKNGDSLRKADLDIVDLAGSEKYDSGAAAVRLAETANINLSLLSLMNVISALANRKSYVSFRDSVLTRVLQSSLGGRSKVAVIVNISPCKKDEEETISSLRFADDTNGCFLKAPVGAGSNTVHVKPTKTVTKPKPATTATAATKKTTSTVAKLSSDAKKVAPVLKKTETKAPEKPTTAKVTTAVPKKTEASKPVVKPVASKPVAGKAAILSKKPTPTSTTSLPKSTVTKTAATTKPTTAKVSDKVAAAVKSAISGTGSKKDVKVTTNTAVPASKTGTVKVGDKTKTTVDTKASSGKTVIPKTTSKEASKPAALKPVAAKVAGKKSPEKKPVAKTDLAKKAPVKKASASEKTEEKKEAKPSTKTTAVASTKKSIVTTDKKTEKVDDKKKKETKPNSTTTTTPKKIVASTAKKSTSTKK